MSYCVHRDTGEKLCLSCHADSLGIPRPEPFQMDDGRFDWDAPRPPKCEACSGRHEGETCEEFESAQVERLKTDIRAYFWHMGYRRAQEPVYDTEAWTPSTEPAPESNMFKSFKPFGAKEVSPPTS